VCAVVVIQQNILTDAGIAGDDVPAGGCQFAAFCNAVFARQATGGDEDDVR
jgi:hypothetical protein